MRLLLVDDDAGFRALLRTTFEVVDVELDEADNAASAAAVFHCFSKQWKTTCASQPNPLQGLGDDFHSRDFPLDGVLREAL